MAQKYNIHTKSQQALYKEYRNLLRRTRRFKGTHIEIENRISKLLESARGFLTHGKMSPKITSEIKKLTKDIHSMRGEKLSKSYINKEAITKFTVINKYGEYFEANVMTDKENAQKIIADYRKELITQLTNFKTNKEHRKSGDDFHGLDSLLLQLDNDIRTKGELAVATMISQFKPETSLEEKYYSIESFEFLRSIGELGRFELPEDVTDEEAEDY